MRLPRSISTQHMGSVAAFLIAGSMVSFALGQQIGHATRVPRPATTHQSQVTGALGARVAVPAPQQPAPVAQKAPAASHTQPALALIQPAPAAAHADDRHDEHHGGDGHQGSHGDKHGGGGGDEHQGGDGGDD
ncbi:MAG TPA: hypothetical protein VLJ14_01345 [Ktedonobacterales bacterium]|nr:hypothetical protein [Ktedonobacterales bacterium]